MPAAGVVIPVHGFAPYLAEALDSVLAQDPVAVVVVDDGCHPALELHPDHAGRVTVVRRERASGPAAARAAGLEALPAGVDAVALCDADDAWEPGKLEAQLRALEADPGAALVFGRATIVGPDGRTTGERWAEPAPGPLAVADLYAANPIPTSSVLLRRSALEAAGGFEAPVHVAEDWELWLRLAARGGRIVCVPEAGIRYRRHPAGLTADVERLAAAQLEVHLVHGSLVDPATRDRVVAADRRTLARARLRSRLRRVPGVGALLPARDPYR